MIESVAVVGLGRAGPVVRERRISIGGRPAPGLGALPRPSVEKARRVLGWEARIDLRAGLADTVQWLREQELKV